MDITKALRHIQAHTCTQIPKCRSMQRGTRLQEKERALITFWVLRAVAPFFLFSFSSFSSGTCASARVLFSLSGRYTLSILYMLITYLGIRLCAISLARIQCKIPGNNDNLKPNLRFTRTNTHTQMLFSLLCPCSNAILNHPCVLFDNNFPINDL